MSWLHYVAAFMPGIMLIVSEIMPFTKGKANGVLHAIYLALTEAQKVMPPEQK